MNPYLKQIVILITVFVFIIWYQKVDDRKTKRERKTFLEKFKLPILITSIVGLLLNLNINKILGLEECNITQVTVIKPDIKIPKLNSLNISDITDQDVYTELPDF